jgi:hypothetical protein
MTAPIGAEEVGKVGKAVHRSGEETERALPTIIVAVGASTRVAQVRNDTSFTLDHDRQKL